MSYLLKCDNPNCGKIVDLKVYAEKSAAVRIEFPVPYRDKTIPGFKQKEFQFCSSKCFYEIVNNPRFPSTLYSLKITKQ